MWSTSERRASQFLGGLQVRAILLDPWEVLLQQHQLHAFGYGPGTGQWGALAVVQPWRFQKPLRDFVDFTQQQVRHTTYDHVGQKRRNHSGLLPLTKSPHHFFWGEDPRKGVLEVPAFRHPAMGKPGKLTLRG